jgi:hypothetical protein
LVRLGDVVQGGHGCRISVEKRASGAEQPGILGFVPGRQDGQHRAKRPGGVAGRQRQRGVDGRRNLGASRASMRWPAFWPSGTALSAAWTMFSAQPKA